MKCLIIGFLSCIGFFSTSDHDAVIAMFRLSQTDESISLELSFDYADYVRMNQIPDEPLTSAHIQQYLSRTTTWRINDREVRFQVKDIQRRRDHCVVYCTSPIAGKRIQDLQVKNEFLLPLDNHSNIIMVELNGSTKAYRMHADRREIQAAF